jgi:CspA family cold shock protein
MPFRVGSVVIASCAGGALHCVASLSYPSDKQVRPVPTGKVKWYDAEKGFGFLSQEDGGEDVYVRSSALPAGVEGLKAGQRVEFGVASGRRGPQALSLKLIDPPPTLTRPRREAPAEHKHSPDELHGMVEDMITLLESAVQPELRKGRYPDRKTARRVSEVVKAVARELDA